MNDKGITPELINDIVKNVKLILNITDSEKDTILVLYTNMICNYILIKTNRRIFPPELKYLAINLIKDKFDSNNSDNPELQTITSMSEYDRTVNFGASDILKSKLELIAQNQIKENEQLINRYKLLYKS